MEWLTVPKNPLNIYYTKKFVEYINPKISEYIIKKFYPEEKFQQLNFNY